MSCFSYFVFYLWSLGFRGYVTQVHWQVNERTSWECSSAFRCSSLDPMGNFALKKNLKTLIFSFIWCLNRSENQWEDKSSKFRNTWRNHLHSPCPLGAWKIHPAWFKMWRQTLLNFQIFYEDGPCLVCVLPNREILRHLTHFQQTVPQMSKKQITN